MSQKSTYDKRLLKPKVNWKRAWESDNGRSVEDYELYENLPTTKQMPASWPVQDRVKMKLTPEKNSGKASTDSVDQSDGKKVEFFSVDTINDGQKRENIGASVQVHNMEEEEEPPDFSALHILADCAVELIRLSKTPVTETPHPVSEPLGAMCWRISKTFPRSKRSALQHQPRQNWGTKLLPTSEPKIVLEVCDAVLELQDNNGTGLLQNVMPRASAENKLKGINFYKRIGRWTSHIWAKEQQFYIGSYAFASDAASAYDKASLKYFGTHAQLNYNRNDYRQDIDEMAGHTCKAYRTLLRDRAKRCGKVVEGVTVCPRGCFEVRMKDKTPPRKWRLLGTFENLADANRCYMENG